MLKNISFFIQMHYSMVDIIVTYIANVSPSTVINT